MSDVQWHSHGVSFTTDASAINYLEIHTYNISLISPRHQWVKRGNIQVEGIPPEKQYQLNRNVLRLENLLNLRQLSLRIWDVLENHSQAINMFWVPSLLSLHSFHLWFKSSICWIIWTPIIPWQKSSCNFKWVTFKHISVTDVLSNSCEIVLRQMPQELTGEMLTLV